MDNIQTKDFYCDFVLNNKIEVKKVKETENVLAFYHTKPNWTLVLIGDYKTKVTPMCNFCS